MVRARAIDTDYNGVGFDPDNNPKISLLREVVALDPDYALGWADLSTYYNGLAFFDTDSSRFEEFVEESKAAARKAIEAESDSPDGSGLYL